MTDVWARSGQEHVDPRSQMTKLAPGEPRIGKGGKMDDTSCVVAEIIEWTAARAQAADMLGKLPRQAPSGRSAHFQRLKVLRAEIIRKPS